MKRSIQDVKQRRDQLLEHLAASPTKTLTVETIADQLKVSAMTIRRDLTTLHDMGLVERSHGKAKLLSTPQSEGQTDNRNLEGIKLALAHKAATYIKERMTLYLNTSSTVMGVLEAVKNLQITVISNNTHLSQLELNPRTTLMLTGGEIHYPRPALVGDLAAQSIQNIQADMAIIGCTGITADRGITTGDFHEARINRTMIQQARDFVIVVADYRKIGTSSNYLVADPTQIDILITDTFSDPNEIRKLEKLGILVIQVDPT